MPTNVFGEYLCVLYLPNILYVGANLSMHACVHEFLPSVNIRVYTWFGGLPALSPHQLCRMSLEKEITG